MRGRCSLGAPPTATTGPGVPTEVSHCPTNAPLGAGGWSITAPGRSRRHGAGSADRRSGARSGFGDGEEVVPRRRAAGRPPSKLPWPQGLSPSASSRVRPSATRSTRTVSIRRAGTTRPWITLTVVNHRRPGSVGVPAGRAFRAGPVMYQERHMETDETTRALVARLPRQRIDCRSGCPRGTLKGSPTGARR